MEIIGPFLISTVAGLGTMLGSLIVFVNIKKRDINSFICLCLSLSATIMILISILELIPSSFWHLFTNFQLKGLILAVLVFFGGVGVVYLIEKMPNLTKNNLNNKNSLYKVGFLSIIAIFIHNFPEGIVTFMTSVQNMPLGLTLGASILMHNVPEGIAMAVPIYYATKKKSLAFKWCFISALAEPLGALCAFLFLSHFINDIIISIILIIVGGIMISISINELLNEALKYRLKKPLIYGFILGLLIIICSVIIF